jgi:hypothetical protein
MKMVRESLALAGLVFQIAVVWYFWSALPVRMPTHFGMHGTPDGYGGKSVMIILPAVTVFVYGLLTVVSFFPQSMNFPVAVTDENRGRLEAIGLTLLGWLKAELAWTFAYVSWATIQVGLGRSSGLGWGFVPLMLVVLGGTVFINLVRTFRAA